MASKAQQSTYPSVVEQYCALLSVSEAIISNRDLGVLFHDLAERLSSIISFDYISVLLHDAERDVMRLHLWQTPGEGVLRPDWEASVEGTAAGYAWQTQAPLIVHDIDKETRFPLTAEALREQGVKSYYVFPLTSAGRRLGAMGFGCKDVNGCSDESLKFMQQVVKQVAVAVDNALNFESAEDARRELAAERDRLRLLLEVNNAVVTNLDLHELFAAISASLRAVLCHEYMSLSLYDPESEQLRVHALDFAEGRGLVREGISMRVEDTPAGLALAARRPVSLTRRDVEQQFDSEYARRLIDEGLKSGCGFPLIAHGRVLGTLAMASLTAETFPQADIELLSPIADQIAIAVDNSLNFESASSSEQQLARERDRSQLLLEINNAVVSHLDLRELLQAISDCLRKVMRHDFVSLMLYDHEIKQLRARAVDFPNHQSFVDSFGAEGVLIPLEGTRPGLAFTTRRTVLRSRLDLAEFPAGISQRVRDEGVQSACHVPLISHDRTLGVLSVASLREGAFTAEDAELLEQIASQVSIAVENALAYREIEGLKNKLADEKHYLEEEIKTAYNFAEIIGNSRVLKHVLKEVETVAPTDSVVLVQGETGTGKELIARAIHDLSARRERTLVKLNCAAIPTGLLESELFGHERGAFTGAVAQRVGRFEVAHKGTLFLDEIGDIPIELQPKLLRVLQEGEFERLGNSRTVKVDVRLVAATNRDLQAMVAEGTFRSDLYYRLNVFPVHLPPLRERADDIPLLVSYFVQKHSRRMNKRIETIPTAALDALARHTWAGNIRELENFIERAVILTRGTELQAPLGELREAASTDAAMPDAGQIKLVPLEENERRHIAEVLRHTKGVIGGKGGAAEILQLPVSTLRSRMKKLGLN